MTSFNLKALLFLSLLVYIIYFTTPQQQNEYKRTKVELSKLPGWVGPNNYGNSYTGYLRYPIQGNTLRGNSFFWFFPAKENPKKAPTILWLTGGPGCSSMLAVFYEGGPLTYSNESGHVVKPNPYGWNEKINLLFIDNPLGAGFSYPTGLEGEFAYNQENIPKKAVESAQHLYEALRIFFTKLSFDETGPTISSLAKNDFYIFTESYAGKYALSLAKDHLKSGDNIPLKGIALGNSWIAPDKQQKVYGKMGYVTGLANYYEFVKINQLDDKCATLIERHDYKKAATGACQEMWLEMLEKGGEFNPYDYRFKGSYDFIKNEQLSYYLNDPDTKTLLDIEPTSRLEIVDGRIYDEDYMQCSNFVWKNFEVEFQKSYLDYLPEVLLKYRVLVISGQFDIRCAIAGTQEWLRTLPWVHQKTFNYMPLQDLRVNRTMKGLFKSFSTLTHAIIYSSGHMVPLTLPMDANKLPYGQPEAAKFLAERFVYGLSLDENCKKESCVTNVECPNKCSKRGQEIKSGSVCSCQCHFSFTGEDCSISNFSPSFSRSTRFDGYIYGNNYHIYYFNFQEAKYKQFDLKLYLEQKSPLGKLHIFGHGDTKFVSPNAITEATLDTFEFFKLGDSKKKVLEMNDQFISNHSHITVVIYNTVHTDVDYDLLVLASKSGRPADSLVITLIVTNSLLLIVGALLLLTCVLHLIYSKAMSQKPSADYKELPTDIIPLEDLNAEKL